MGGSRGEVLEAVLAVVTDGLLIGDRSGRVVAFSETAPALMGVSAQQLRDGAPPPGWQALHPNGEPLLPENSPGMRCLQTGQRQGPVVARLHLPDGTLRWIEVRAEPVRDADGAVDGVVVSMKDITELRRADEESRTNAARVEALLEESDHGVFEVDLTTGAIARSVRIYRMLGLEPAQLGPRVEDWFEYVHPDDLPTVQEHWARMRAGDLQEFDLEYRLRHSSGRWLWVRVRARAVRRGLKGEAQLVSGNTHDVTRRREAEEGLKVALERLVRLEAEVACPRR